MGRVSINTKCTQFTGVGCNMHLSDISSRFKLRRAPASTCSDTLLPHDGTVALSQDKPLHSFFFLFFLPVGAVDYETIL